MKKIFNKTCTHCHSKDLLFDEHKGEIFCNNCGLIHANIYEIPKISNYIKENNQNKEKYLKNLYIKPLNFLENIKL